MCTLQTHHLESIISHQSSSMYLSYSVHDALALPRSSNTTISPTCSEPTQISIYTSLEPHSQTFILTSLYHSPPHKRAWCISTTEQGTGFCYMTASVVPLTHPASSTPFLTWNSLFKSFVIHISSPKTMNSIRSIVIYVGLATNVHFSQQWVSDPLAPKKWMLFESKITWTSTVQASHPACFQYWALLLLIDISLTCALNQSP